ncbi:MAG: PucR family transcriptional regulator ligand-binding domain-containing protein [Micropruina sp.]|nr:PucR family transcriptional regulator ligand-binding domain-containing protein [Micropruina sp.]
MSVFTVTDLLRLPVLHGSLVVAGHAGLGRRITAVNVMEVPDIESFVHEGDLLLTTAYPLRDRSGDLAGLIQALSDRGLAGLAVKLGRYLDELPAEAVVRADALAFPLLVVPDNLSFNEVIGAAFAIILLDEQPEADTTEAIRERLTRVALAGGGLDAIARTLALALDRGVRLRAAGAVYSFDHEGVQGGGGSSRPRQRFPITVGEALRGSLEVDGTEALTLTQVRLVRQACFAAALYVAQVQASVALDERLRTVFLEELVAGGEGDRAILAERSHLFSWNLSGSRAVVLAQLGRELDTAALAQSAPQESAAQIPLWSRGSEAVAIIPANTRAEAVDWARQWQAGLEQQGRHQVRVAVGSLTRHPREIKDSHTHARQALAIAEATGRDLVQHHDLAIERLLLSVGHDDLDDLATGQLGPVEEFDARSGGQLSRTLECYLGHGNAALAGRELGVHYNTMKHRLARISELLDADLSVPETRLSLAVALAARRLQGLASRVRPL